MISDLKCLKSSKKEIQLELAWKCLKMLSISEPFQDKFMQLRLIKSFTFFPSFLFLKILLKPFHIYEISTIFFLTSQFALCILKTFGFLKKNTKFKTLAKLNIFKSILSVIVAPCCKLLMAKYSILFSFFSLLNSIKKKMKSKEILVLF